MGLGGFTYSCTWSTWSQTPELHQEIETQSTTTVSGVFCWLSNDPIGISGGLNQYAFCADRPTCVRDPFGLDDIAIGGVLGGGYSGTYQNVPVPGVDDRGHVVAGGQFAGLVSSVALGGATLSGGYAAGAGSYAAYAAARSFAANACVGIYGFASPSTFGNFVGIGYAASVVYYRVVFEFVAMHPEFAITVQQLFALYDAYGDTMSELGSRLSDWISAASDLLPGDSNDAHR